MLELASRAARAGGVALSLLLAGQAVAGAAEKKDFVLIRAEMLRHLDGDDGFVPYACDPQPESSTDCVTIGGYSKMRLKVTAVLAGELPHHYATAYLPSASYFKLTDDSDKIFAVALIGKDGILTILAWDRIPEGLCSLGDEDIAELGRNAAAPDFADKLRAAVQRFPCKER